MLTDVVAALTDWVVALAGSPWLYVALYVFATVDGFFPPIPSESLVIALATLSVATGDPSLVLIMVVAALGAFSGDQIAYSIGRRIPVDRLRMMQGARMRRTLSWAQRALAERGATFIIAARYVPIGRVAVNMTAGTVHFPRPRFTLLAAIAAVSWSAYSVALGVGAGVWLGDHPLLAVVAGVACGILLGFAIDPIIRFFVRGRGGRPGVLVTAGTAGTAVTAGTAGTAVTAGTAGAAVTAVTAGAGGARVRTGADA